MDAITLVTSLDSPAVPRDDVIAIIGAPYAGKSTFTTRFPATQVISLDTARAMVCDDPGDQDATPEAVTLAHLWLAVRCRHHRTSVFDATNTRPDHRAPLLAIARPYRIPVHALVFDVPETVCQARRGGRDRVVPAHVVTAYAAEVAALVAAPAVLLAEGFASVTLYRPEVTEHRP